MTAMGVFARFLGRSADPSSTQKGIDSPNPSNLQLGVAGMRGDGAIGRALVCCVIGPGSPSHNTPCLERSFVSIFVDRARARPGSAASLAQKR